jgi:gamma-carbonic anhydrase
MIIPYKGKFPRLAPGVFVAENATIIGDVEIGECSSVWPGAVIRGDMQPVRIGDRVSVQDNSVLHVSLNYSPLVLGSDITIGHRSILHGCKVGNLCLIGMGSIVMDDCEIGDGCIVAAGSVLTHGTIVPPRTLVMGIPAKPKRETTEQDLQMVRDGVEDYCKLAREYREYSVNPYLIKERFNGKK